MFSAEPKLPPKDPDPTPSRPGPPMPEPEEPGPDVLIPPIPQPAGAFAG